MFPNAAPHIHTRGTAANQEEFYYRHLTVSQPSEDEVTIALVCAQA